MSVPHFETISDQQRELLELLGSLQIGPLAGGTALSLQIGHRRSYDLDFVISQEITNDLVVKIKEVLSHLELSQRLSSTTQYTAFAGDVKVTYFQDAAPLNHQVIDFNQFSLVSTKDIFSSKLYVMGRRATWRDYVDVAVCLDQEIASLSKAIEEATKRYQISERWILDPLTYFDDLEITPIEWVGKSYSDEEVQNIILNNVENYLRQ